MDALTLPAVVATVLAAALASIAVWAPRKSWVRGVAVATAMLFVPLALIALIGLLSRPKPVALEWDGAGLRDARVIAASLREGEAIYVWLQIDRDGAPRAYVLPWDRQQAEDLQRAMREARAKRTGLRMRQPFEPTWDRREPRFYALPQPPMPPKTPPGEAPATYVRPGTAA